MIKKKKKKDSAATTTTTTNSTNDINNNPTIKLSFTQKKERVDPFPNLCLNLSIHDSCHPKLVFDWPRHEASVVQRPGSMSSHWAKLLLDWPSASASFYRPDKSPLPSRLRQKGYFLAKVRWGGESRYGTVVLYMGVSKNRGTPKWMVYSGKPYQNGWFGGTTISGNIHIFFCVLCFFSKSVRQVLPHSWEILGSL